MLLWLASSLPLGFTTPSPSLSQTLELSSMDTVFSPIVLTQVCPRTETSWNPVLLTSYSPKLSTQTPLPSPTAPSKAAAALLEPSGLSLSIYLCDSWSNMASTSDHGSAGRGRVCLCLARGSARQGLMHSAHSRCLINV